MNTGYELVTKMRRFKNGEDVFADIIRLSVNELYFEAQFITCDEYETSQLLCNLYTEVHRRASEITALDQLGSWMETMLTESTARWLMHNKRDMIRYEIRGQYKIPEVTEETPMGTPLSPAEYTYVVECALCNLPEIFRQTAIAHFHDDLPSSKLSYLLCIDEETLANRLRYIENSVHQRLKEHCFEHSYSMHPLTQLDLRLALMELGHSYQYQFTDELIGLVNDSLAAPSPATLSFT